MRTPPVTTPGPGDSVLLRYWYMDGTLQAAFPLRLVQQSDERRVGWLPVGTEVAFWALPDGRDPRSLPLDERFAADLTTTLGRWRTNDALRICFRDRPYQVVHFWNGGSFLGWYVNFESPGRWTDTTIESRDWHLDLWIAPDGKPTWKDEDEAEFAATFGYVAADELTTAREAGDEIIATFDRWLADLGDWREFQPADDWTPLGLPPDWDKTSGESLL